MRVALFTSLSPTVHNGETIYTARVIRALRELACEVTVYMVHLSKNSAQETRGQWIADLDIEGVHYVSVAAAPRPASVARAVFQLIWQSQRGRPWDAVFFRLAYFQLVALARRLYKNATIVWLHDGVVEEISYVHRDLPHLLLEKSWSFLEVAGSRFVDWELPVSAAMQQYSLSKGYKPRRGQRVLPCVVEIDRFRPRIRGKLDWPHLTFGFAGSMSAWHGFETACAYLTALREAGVDVRLDVLTANVAKARETMDRFGLDGSVRPLPHTLVPQAMDQWDFAISTQEGGLVTKVCSPLKVTEALAKGLPLIMTPDVGDFSRLVEQEGVGVVIAREGGPQWKDSVQALQQIADNYGSVQQRARRVAEDMYSMMRMCAVLREVLGK